MTTVSAAVLLFLVMDPLGNVFVKAELGWMKVLFCGGGLVVGLVVGGGAMALLRRRRGRPA